MRIATFVVHTRCDYLNMPQFELMNEVALQFLNVSSKHVKRKVDSLSLSQKVAVKYFHIQVQ